MEDSVLAGGLNAIAICCFRMREMSMEASTLDAPAPWFAFRMIYRTIANDHQNTLLNSDFYGVWINTGNINLQGKSIRVFLNIGRRTSVGGRRTGINVPHITIDVLIKMAL